MTDFSSAPKGGDFPATDFDRVDIDVEDQRLAAKLLEESPLKSLAAKRAMVESILAMRLQIRVLRVKLEEGKIKTAEIKLLSGLASNLRRSLEAIGCVDLTEEEEEV